MFKNNLSLKLLSVVIAIFIWLFISNVNDPVVQKVYTNIPVTISNGSYIESQGMTYRIDSDSQYVTVTLTGSASRVYNKSEAIEVNADLTQIVNMDSDPVMVPLTATCTGLSAENITVSPLTIPVEIEDREEKTFMIAASKGESSPGAGYEVGKIYANPEKVKIDGPSSIVDKIDRVVANVSVDGLTGDTKKKADLTLYDKNQEIISDSDMQYLTFDIGDPEVEVYIKLWKTLSGISFSCEPSGSPAYGYFVSSVTTTPSEISIAGTDDAITKIRQNGRKIEIPSKLIDVSGAKDTVEQKIQLADILPEDTMSVTDAADTIIVEVEVLPYGSKQMEIATKNIDISNLTDSLQAVFSDTKITVTLQGRTQDLSEIAEDDIKASIDLKGLKAGNHKVEVDFDLPDGITLMEDVEVSVDLVTYSQTK